MSWVDVGAVVVVALAVVDGASSGLPWALLEAAALVGSALTARSFAPDAEPYLFKVTALTGEDLAWSAHVVVFGLVASLLFGVLVLLHPVAKKRRFRNDRWFGGAVGLLNGTFVALAVGSMLLAADGAALRAELGTSRVVALAARVAPSPLGALLPAGTAARAAALAVE